MLGMSQDRRIIPSGEPRSVGRFQDSIAEKRGFKERSKEKFDRILEKEIDAVEELPEPIKDILNKLKHLEWITPALAELYSKELHTAGIELIYDLKESKESLRNKWTERHLEEITDGLVTLVLHYGSRHAAAWVVQFWKELPDYLPSRGFLRDEIALLITTIYPLERVSQLSAVGKKSSMELIKHDIAGYLKPFEFSEEGSYLVLLFNKKAGDSQVSKPNS